MCQRLHSGRTHSTSMTEVSMHFTVGQCLRSFLHVTFTTDCRAFFTMVHHISGGCCLEAVIPCFRLPHFFLGTSVKSTERRHWRQTDCVSLWASTTNEAAANGISRLSQHNLWLGYIHFLFSFLFYHKLPVTTVIVTSLRGFLHSRAWNNSHSGLQSRGGSGSFTALWSASQMASESQMMYSLQPNYNFFITRPQRFVLNADVLKPVGMNGLWNKHDVEGNMATKAACWGEM